MAAKLISIIGPVAAGKTTLAECLAAELGAVLIYEDYAGNPFLAKSFMGCDDLMLPSQLYFLLSRAAQLCEATWPSEGLFLSDYGFCQDRIFAAAKLSADDLETYDRVSSRIVRTVHSPDVIIHIASSLETLQSRIVKRGRDYETGFGEDGNFLQALRRGNAEITPPPGCVMLQLDSDKIDYRQPGERDNIVHQLREALE